MAFAPLPKVSPTDKKNWVESSKFVFGSCGILDLIYWLLLFFLRFHPPKAVAATASAREAVRGRGKGETNTFTEMNNTKNTKVQKYKSTNVQNHYSTKLPESLSEKLGQTITEIKKTHYR